MSSIAFQIGGLSVRWYGILIVVGIVLAMLVALYNCKRQRINPEHLLNIVLLVVPCGIIGARLYYVIFNWEFYAANPGDIIAVWHGGLAIHGGIIAGMLALLGYAIYSKTSFRVWGDILAPGLILAQAIGRWGNFFNQEAYGYETTVPWAMYIDGAYRHPTFLYESIWCLVGFILLMVLWQRWEKRRSGDIMACYLIFYSLGRVWIEWFRTDSLMLFGVIKVAMLISLIGVLAGLVLLLWNRRFPVQLSAMRSARRSGGRSNGRSDRSAAQNDAKGSKKGGGKGSQDKKGNKKKR